MSGRGGLPSPLLVVTDRHGAGRPLAATVAAILDAGARWVWLRDRDLDAHDRRILARDLLALVQAVGGRLVIGGDPGLAAALGADGVHLTGGATPADIARARSDLGSDALVGVSAHAPAEVEAAARAGADYATLSPIHATASKPGYGPALGLGGLTAACRFGIPVIALGGIGPAQAAACGAAGATGVAVMGGLMRAAEPAAATRAYLAALRSAGEPRGNA